MNLRKAFFLSLFLVTLAAMGCRDRCARLDCANGNCVEGECVCEAGYEGSLCETLINEKYSGTYTVEEECVAGSDNYQLTMTPDASNPAQVKISGLWERQDTVIGNVDDTGLIVTIERQALGNREVSGTGTSEDQFGLTIQFTYDIFNTGAGSPFDNCTATFNKD